MYAWPDMYGYDPMRLQQYGYGYPADMAAQQWGWRGRWGGRWFWPWFFFLPFAFRRWWW